jgi:hypothetical protein
MNKSSANSPPLKLPALDDPASRGIFFARHMLSIIVLIFIFLALSVITATSITQLDVTIKTNANPIARCQNNASYYCAQINISDKKAQQIAINNRVLLIVENENDDRQMAIEAIVIGIENSATNSGGELSRTVIVEVIPGDLPSDTPPKYALIIVGSQSGWRQLVTAAARFFD